MQEHLIPQDISNYKFHLIGELDLKQFGEIMAGVIIAVIINSFGWPGIIKWPLMIAAVAIGLVAAFVPLGGQPLTHWIIVFVKALFSPTKFYWHKETVVPSYFNYELPARNRQFLDVNSTFNDSPAKKHRALMYFSTLDHSTSNEDDPLELFTDSNVARATEDFTYNTPATTPSIVAPKKVLTKPQVGNDQSIRQRQIVTPSQESLDAFLQTSSIFQPVEILEQITAADAKMAAADANLAALTNDSTQVEDQPLAATQTTSPTPFTELTAQAPVTIAPEIPTVFDQPAPSLEINGVVFPTNTIEPITPAPTSSAKEATSPITSPPPPPLIIQQ